MKSRQAKPYSQVVYEDFMKQVSEKQSRKSGSVSSSVSNEVVNSTICTSGFILLSLVVLPNFTLPFVTFHELSAVGLHPAVPVLHLQLSWMQGHEGSMVLTHDAQT